MHARQQPRRHRLLHHVYYLAINLDQLAALHSFKLLGYNRAAWFQLRDRDYGFTINQPLQDWARTALQQFTSFVPTQITLITLPRVLGVGFNPVSFWCYFDADHNLRAVLAEVNNTFKQRHAYVCRHHDDGIIHANDELTAQKVFHVSPFFDVRGEYRFRFDVTVDKINIAIDYYDGAEKLLSTAVAGPRHTLSDRALRRAFFQHPWVTLKVILLIHLHAIILITKRLRYRVPASLPTANITS